MIRSGKLAFSIPGMLAVTPAPPVASATAAFTALLTSAKTLGTCLVWPTHGNHKIERTSRTWDRTHRYERYTHAPQGWRAKYTSQGGHDGSGRLECNIASSVQMALHVRR